MDGEVLACASSSSWVRASMSSFMGKPLTVLSSLLCLSSAFPFGNGSATKSKSSKKQHYIIVLLIKKYYCFLLPGKSGRSLPMLIICGDIFRADVLPRISLPFVVENRRRCHISRKYLSISFVTRFVSTNIGTSLHH